MLASGLFSSWSPLFNTLMLWTFASSANKFRVDAFPLTQRQATLKSLSSAEIAAFRPFTSYASASYCEPAALRQWTCGRNCEANPTFKPVAAGGDGNNVQFWYVGIDPTLKTIIVGHQGTDPSKLMPILTDANLRLDEPDPALFPKIGKDIKVHNGFAEAHAETAKDVRAAVEKALKDSGLKTVTLVGHSLGGALSLLDAVSLPLFFPGVTFRAKVGNQAFASYVDKNVPLDRINNKDDVVPILPGRFLGFRHASGEKHIQDDLSWLVCPGGDNTDPRCSTGDVKNVFDGKVTDHRGPYDTIEMGC